MRSGIRTGRRILSTRCGRAPLITCRPPGQPGHRDLVMLGLHNGLATPGAVTMLGYPVNLHELTVDTSVVAGIADHISPWRGCYRSARLLGSKDLRFVLSSSGHIAALVNPPGNPKASYRVGTVDDKDPAAWAQKADKRADSWWPDYVDWLAQREHEVVDAPDAPGGSCMPPIEPAPGT